MASPRLSRPVDALVEHGERVARHLEGNEVQRGLRRCGGAVAVGGGRGAGFFQRADVQRDPLGGSGQRLGTGHLPALRADSGNGGCQQGGEQGQA